MASSVDGARFGGRRTVRSRQRRHAGAPCALSNQEPVMKRTPLRVEPISGYLEAYRKGSRKGPIHPVVIAGEMVFISGLPPFDPDTGEIARVPLPRQAELVLEQMKLCLEAAGSSLSRVIKCNVYCTPDPSHFATRCMTGIFPKMHRRGSS